MTISAFDLFKIGIGPSSSHTVGPMRAAGHVRGVARRGRRDGQGGRASGWSCSVRSVPPGMGTAASRRWCSGSPGPSRKPWTLRRRPRWSTGPGRPGSCPARRPGGRVRRGQRHRAAPPQALAVPLQRHAFTAVDDQGSVLAERTYYSVGGGFVLGADAAGAPAIVPDATPVPYPFRTGAELLAHAEASGLPISGVMMANELVSRDEAEVRDGLLRIWRVMQDCVRAGCAAEGVLPGGLKVRRRARTLRETLERTGDTDRPAVRDGVGDALRARRQRGERGRRAGGHRAHQRRGRHHPRGAALLHDVRAGRLRRRCG